MSYILIPVVLNQIYSNPYKVVFISTGPHNRKEGVPNLCRVGAESISRTESISFSNLT